MTLVLPFNHAEFHIDIDDDSHSFHDALVRFNFLEMKRVSIKLVKEQCSTIFFFLLTHKDFQLCFLPLVLHTGMQQEAHNTDQSQI